MSPEGVDPHVPGGLPPSPPLVESLRTRRAMRGMLEAIEAAYFSHVSAISEWERQMLVGGSLLSFFAVFTF